MTDQRTNNCTLCILIPLILGAVGLAALFWYNKDSTAEAIQNDLSFKSNELLKEKQIGGAVVNMDGRDAILTGTVISQQRSNEIEDIISSLDGVRIVDNQLKVAKPEVVEEIPEPTPEPEPEPEPQLEPETEITIAPVVQSEPEAEVIEDLLQTLDLTGITFLFGSNEITPEGKLILDDVVTVLTEHSGFDVAIEGHTDSVGNENLNLQLSQLRAQSVLSYIASSGIQVERLSAEGFGETLPIYDNDTAQGRALNRRIEFNVSRQQ
ncbi:MAG: OmpA family protein [Gammaproteobacteria bacterium]